MVNNNEHLNNLTEIRSIMERTTTFVSLSGVSGVFVGIFAILGALAAFMKFGFVSDTHQMADVIFNTKGCYNTSFLVFAFLDAALVLLFALGVVVFFSARKARKKGTTAWNKTTKLMIINLMIPLITGGLLALVFIYHAQIYYISSIVLIFYGMALLNAGKYTLKDVQFLGVLEIILGLLAAIFIGNGFLFWILGFGVLHILYGIYLYFKYDK